MSLEIRITNDPPRETDVPHDPASQQMLDIFQAYAGTPAAAVEKFSRRELKGSNPPILTLSASLAEK
jgi:hypothetical protein